MEIACKRNNPGFGVPRASAFGTPVPVLHCGLFCPAALFAEGDVYPEREDEMATEIRYHFDENDDVADIIDAVLTAPGIRIRYIKEGPMDWIGMIGDQDMEDALRALPELEQDIIEKYFLQRKTLVDIASDLDLPYDLLMGHLRAIKARLVLHV